MPCLNIIKVFWNENPIEGLIIMPEYDAITIIFEIRWNVYSMLMSEHYKFIFQTDACDGGKDSIYCWIRMRTENISSIPCSWRLPFA